MSEMLALARRGIEQLVRSRRASRRDYGATSNPGKREFQLAAPILICGSFPLCSAA
jgi:hypothetical protein